MKKLNLQTLISDVKSGGMTRRAFVNRMLSVGITAPMAGMMLSHAGVAQTAETFEYKPTKAGGGGTLKILQAQGQTLLNPHFAVGAADQDGCSIFYEPLAAWDGDGNLVAVLAEDVPTIENGGLAEDGKSVTWKLKKGVTWHDGMPFTADDLIFNAAFAANPETSAYTLSTYKDITVEKIDDHTIKITFDTPTPFWADAFVGTRGMIIPKHKFEEFAGTAARESPTNVAPVGTGSYIIEEFRPGDRISARMNPDYHVANRPYFDALEIKGGGDNVSAARAVLQTGEYDFAFNLAIEDTLLDKLESEGKGYVQLVGGGYMEHVQLNTTDPYTEVDGERASANSQHPAFKEKAVRDAMGMLVDREAIANFVYGRAGFTTANFINVPQKFASPNTAWEFDIDKANKTLDDAGWMPASDGIREKDGVRLSFLYQTSSSAERQKCQAIIKQACAKAGIEIELKAVAGSVFFSSDPGNPDTFAHFYADMQQYTSPMKEPDPGLYIQQFLSSQAAQKANNWQNRNVTRWQNADFDKAYAAAAIETDPVKRAELFVEMNDLVIKDGYIIPLCYRQIPAGLKTGLKAPLSAWGSHLWQIADWYMEA